MFLLCVEQISYLTFSLLLCQLEHLLCSPLLYTCSILKTSRYCVTIAFIILKLKPPLTLYVEPLQSIQAACAVGTGHGILGAVCLWYSCSYWLGWQHQPKSCLHSSCPSSSHPPSYSNSLCFSPSILSIMENWQLQHILWLLIIPFTPEHVCCPVVCVCFKKFRCVTH